MQNSVLYAKAIAMLVHEVKAQANPDALKALLTQARNYSRAAGLQIELNGGKLLVDGVDASAASGGLEDLVQALNAHGVGRVSIAEGASPKELLQLSILLSRAPGTGNGSVLDEARELSLWYVRLFPVARPNTSAMSTGARELGALDPQTAAEKSRELAQQVQMAVDANDAFRATALLRLIMDAEHVSEGARPAWTAAFDSAATPAALRIVTQDLPNAGDDRPAVLAMLKRAGAPAANALIAQLMAADKLEVRRAYFDAIVELRTGVPLLVDMLRHPQWYIVRNAALLLGEMRATEAEGALSRLMSHADERVRVAAATALSQIDSPNARGALQQGLLDDAVEVRRRSLRGFVADQGGTSSGALVAALDQERDVEVQVEILAAMGRVRSPDAVQKLIRLCSPAGATAPAAFRIAAAEALTTARGQAAVPFLRAMLDDRDMNVRASARALINSLSGR